MSDRIRRPKRLISGTGHQNRSGGLPSALPLALSPSSSSLAQALLPRKTTHPSIYRKRITQLTGSPKVGDWVAVSHGETESGQPELFAYGLYNPKSEIAIRLVHWSDVPPGDNSWDQMIDRALSLRTGALELDQTTNCYRIIHAEADGFPGLAVDRFDNCLSAEVFSAAMSPRVEEILHRIAGRMGTEHWLISPSPHLLSQEGYELRSRSTSNLPEHVVVNENGTRYRVHFSSGHKTGFFCDQRENRYRLSEWSRDRTVLDLCCYTGGFSVMAAHRGRAKEVIGVDLDAEPLEIARQNAAMNQVRVKFTQADAFAYMRDMLRSKRQFDIVVLDPPKLIRNRSEIEEGTRKHFDLNRLAMQLVAPGGLMLTCSCAGLLPETEFIRLVRAAARSAFLPTEYNPNPIPRNMQILSKAGAAACHPVSANCPETEYFKSLWLRL
jgi:23S rRNA (cytosine1962-C5)-methyltransferase